MVVQQDGLVWQVPSCDAAVKPHTSVDRRPSTASLATPRGGGSQRNSIQGISSLKSGGKAMLTQRPQLDSVSRAKLKHELRHRLPLEMPSACGMSSGLHPPRPNTSIVCSREAVAPNLSRVGEVSNEVQRLLESRIWGRDIDYRKRDSALQKRQSVAHGGMESCMDELVFGHDMDYTHAGDEAIHHGLDTGFNPWEAGEIICNLDEFRLLSWQVQHVLARARGRGARGLRKLDEAFQAASKQGSLDFDSFTKVAMATGLCRSLFECRCAFRLFAGAADSTGSAAQTLNSNLQVSVLIRKLHDSLSPERAAIVDEIWRRSDPEDSGEVEMRDLLAVFDARRLNRVLGGEVEAVEAEREFFEAMGAFSTVLPDLEKECFALNEAAARRRGQPTGGQSSPLESAAGKPTGQAIRSQHDCQIELSARKPEVNLSHRVSATDFAAYYTCVSLATPDHDVLFKQIVQSPWMSMKVHHAAIAARSSVHCKGKGARHSSLPVMAMFEDGFRRMLQLLDDTGLQEASQGASGQHCNQMWTWGPNVRKEVVRRLEALGHHGIVSVKLTPA